MLLELDIEPLSPRLEQVRPVAAADHRADHAHDADPRRDPDPDQVRVVTRARALGLDQLDPALLGDGGGVDHADLLLGVAAQHAAQHLDREQAGVAIGDPAQELGPMRSTDEPSAMAMAIPPSVGTAAGRGRAPPCPRGIAGTFTALVTTPPVRAATTCSAACKPARSVPRWSTRRGAA